MSESIKKIEALFSEDAGQRGIGNIILEGEFERALDDLISSTKVMILTGFVIRAAGVGETDGPLGALSLANALEKAGKKVMLITDRFSDQLLIAGKEILGLEAEVVTVPYDNSADFCYQIYSMFQPDHFLAIERPGKAANGHFHSMRAEQLTDIIPDTDVLMIEAQKNGIRTTAIGDGGNELGMGKAKDRIIKHINYGETIAAEVAADNLLLTGVSNWGGHGIAAGLSLRVGQFLMYSAETEVKLLEAIVKKGAVDGCTREQVSTVDGLSLEKNISIIKEMNEIVAAAIVN